ncbi:MAG TPA: integrase family protein [Rhizomicrobium sp.]|jgi:hypothetical protein|nr:integrase family protein [Rhizomicrobium sp.]
MADKVVLTDRYLKALKPAPQGKRIVTWDAVQPHLGIRVTDNRSALKATWVVVKRMAGVTAPVVHVLGSYPAVPLVDARKQARTVLGQIVEGVHPTRHRVAQREAAVRKAKDSFAAVAEDFISKYVSKKRSAREATRIINLYLVPTFGHLQMADVKRRQITELLDDIERGQFITTEKPHRKLGGPVMADHVLASLRKLMNWHASRDDDFVSPVVKDMARTKPKQRARKRILSDDEIRALWVVLDEWDAEATAAARKAGQKGETADVFGALVRSLLMTAQRREEVAAMARGEVDGALWTIPAARHKTGDDAGAKLVPLPRTALATIAKVAQVDGSDLVFSTNGTTPYSGFSKGKRQLDEAMLAKLRAAATARKDKAALARVDEIARMLEAARKGDKKAREKLKTAWWTLHDLRRTAKTLMTRAGVRPDISERVLGHVIEGVEGVYDRHDYLAEKKEALERLAAIVTQIANPTEDGKVVPLRRRK